MTVNLESLPCRFGSLYATYFADSWGLRNQWPALEANNKPCASGHGNSASFINRLGFLRELILLQSQRA
jgi:hypothetical protein